MTPPLQHLLSLDVTTGRPPSRFTDSLTGQMASGRYLQHVDVEVRASWDGDLRSAEALLTPSGRMAFLVTCPATCLP